MKKDWLKDARTKPRKPRKSNWLNISCWGDAEFKNAFVALSDELGVDQGVLTRQAIDAMFGERLDVLMARSAASSDADTHKKTNDALTA